MSIDRVQATFVCDKCENGYTVVVQRLTQVRVKIRALGWSVIGSKDYCPNCSHKMAPAPVKP